MEATNLAKTEPSPPEKAGRGAWASPFPYSNWGPQAAVLGTVLAILVDIILGLPALAFTDSDNELTTTGNVVAQIGLVLGLLLVPPFVARSRGADSIGEALRRLGVRAFRPFFALRWMAATVGAYLVFAVAYASIFGEPKQDDIADGFGPLPFQILLVVFAASISEELCFRGMLFGGLRERLPRYAAALLSGVIFGSLHAFTGVSAVPPLIAFAFLAALLYEKTGSVVPGILLHMANNSAALLAQ